MKKLFALLLAVMMVLASASVLAEEPTSPTDEVNEPTVMDDKAIIVITELGEKGNELFNQLNEKINNGESVLDLFSEETKAAVEAMIDTPVVHEMFGVAIGPGYTEGMGDYVAPLKFGTAYEAGEAVAPILNIGGEEFVLDAEVTEDGIVNTTFTADQLAKLAAGAEAFVVMVNGK